MGRIDKSAEKKSKAIKKARDMAVNFKYPPDVPKKGESIIIFKVIKALPLHVYAVEETVINRWVEVKEDANGKYIFEIAIKVSTIDRKTHGHNFFIYDQGKWREGSEKVEIIRPSTSREDSF